MTPLEAQDMSINQIGTLHNRQTTNQFAGLADAQRRQYEAQIDADRQAMESARLNPYAKEQRQATMEEWNKFNRGEIDNTPDDPNADNTLKQTAMKYGSRVYSPTNYADYDAALKNLTDDKTIHMVAGSKKFTIVPYMDNIPQGSKVSIGQAREYKSAKATKEQEPQLIDIYETKNRAMADTDLGKLKAMGLIKGDIKELEMDDKKAGYTEEAQNAMQIFNTIATANPNLSREQVHRLIKTQLNGAPSEQAQSSSKSGNTRMTYFPEGGAMQSRNIFQKPASGNKTNMPQAQPTLSAEALATLQALPDKHPTKIAVLAKLGNKQAPVMPNESPIVPQESLVAKPTIKMPPRKVVNANIKRQTEPYAKEDIALLKPEAKVTKSESNKGIPYNYNFQVKKLQERLKYSDNENEKIALRKGLLDLKQLRTQPPPDPNIAKQIFDDISKAVSENINALADVSMNIQGGAGRALIKGGRQYAKSLQLEE